MCWSVSGAGRPWDRLDGGVGWLGLGDRPGLPGVVEAEVDESAEVDRGDSEGELGAVGFDAAVADPASSVGDDPGDGTFDHGPVLAVVGDDLRVGPGMTGGDEFVVVISDGEASPVFGGGAPVT